MCPGTPSALPARRAGALYLLSCLLPGLISPPGGQVLTSSLPPSPACELESPLEIVPRSLEDLGRGHLWGGGPRNMPSSWGGLGPAASRRALGPPLECAEPRPRESLHLVRLSLGLPGTNQPGLAGGKAACNQGLRALGWNDTFLPVYPAPVRPQLLLRTHRGRAWCAQPLPLPPAAAPARQVLGLGALGALREHCLEVHTGSPSCSGQRVTCGVAVGLQGSGQGQKEGPRASPGWQPWALPGGQPSQTSVFLPVAWV